MLLVLAFVIGATIAILICLGQGAYLLDAAIAVLAFAGLRWEAALGILIVEYAARRVPYLARSCVHTIGVHPLFVPVLFPGAVEKTVDTPQAPQPAVTSVMSNEAERALQTRRYRIQQSRLRRVVAQTSEKTKQAVTGNTIKQPETTTEQLSVVTAQELKILADLHRSNVAPSVACKQLDGYRPERYHEFKAKADAVYALLEK